MTELHFNLPKDQASIIKVIGVGGGGSNAVNFMFRHGIKGVNYVVCNTDEQALEASPVPNRIQLGPLTTEGLGAGSMPHRGREAAEESVENIKDLLSKNTKMVFITAGMGGGTGTGAAPVIARLAKDMGILTVGIVTTPFKFEGRRKINQAIEGLEELQRHCDSVLVVSNDKISSMYGNMGQAEAFAKADTVLMVAAKSISEIITVSGSINVDFADVQYVMSNSGVAIMGSALASGEGRALRAVKEALMSPLLDDNDITGAKHILVNISSGEKEALIDEINEVNQYVQEAAGNDTDIIFGTVQDPSLGDNICVTVIATGFQRKASFGTAAKVETNSLLNEQPVPNTVVTELNEKVVPVADEIKAEVAEALESPQSVEQLIEEEEEISMPEVMLEEPDLNEEMELEAEVEIAVEEEIQTSLSDDDAILEQMIADELAQSQASSASQTVEAEDLMEEDDSLLENFETEAVQDSAETETELEDGNQLQLEEEVLEEEVLEDEVQADEEAMTDTEANPEEELFKVNGPETPGLKVIHILGADDSNEEEQSEEEPLEVELPLDVKLSSTDEPGDGFNLEIEEEEQAADDDLDQIRLVKKEESEDLEKSHMKVQITNPGDERKRQLRALSYNQQLKTNMLELENEPAYQRKNVELSNLTHSSEKMISKFTVNDSPVEGESRPEIRENNSFLYDNVD